MDAINPDYYKSYPVETIDMMVAVFGKEATRQHCLLTAFKYRMRLGKKDNVQQDLSKENWYLNKAESLISEEKITPIYSGEPGKMTKGEEFLCEVRQELKEICTVLTEARGTNEKNLRQVNFFARDLILGLISKAEGALGL